MLESLTRRADNEYVGPWCQGVIHLALGDVDEAFRHFERACLERNGQLLILSMHPRFELLGSDRRRHLASLTGLPFD